MKLKNVYLNCKYDKNYRVLQSAVISTLQYLETSALQSLSSDGLYNETCKAEFTEEMEKVILKIKNEGYSSLEVEPTTCKFCFPTAKAYNFNNPESGEVIIRYVIHEESTKRFIIQECRNKKLLGGENGLPF